MLKQGNTGGDIKVEADAVGTADDKYRWERGKLKVKKTKMVNIDTVTLNFKSENYCTYVEVKLDDFIKICREVLKWR